ncbi:MAG: MBL fold metallo-hydrolase [Candidatus Amulumruptor caecigallinarius]|nr:MBL fold metallo-hydrolase [Candidatus Amulumruptor caecigallinarius]
MNRRKIHFDIQPTLPFEEWDSDSSDPIAVAPAESDTESEISDAAADGGNGNSGRLRYISFGSGSSGNSCYIGNDRGGIVVDAGIRAEQIEDVLKINGISMKHVRGLVLTHDHSDHVRFSYSLLRRNKHLSLFCTPRVLNGLMRRHSISRRIRDFHVAVFKEIPFKVADMTITAFDVPHDGSDNMGFSIEYGKHRFVLATDLGEVTDRARYYMSRANYLVLESNYDSDMLRLGSYPEYLKARIRSGNGHLDNRDAAAFLGEIVNPELKYVFLCHLSKDNNTPALALKESRMVLEQRGISIGGGDNSISDRRADLRLIALPRFEPTRMFVFI